MRADEWLNCMKSKNKNKEIYKDEEGRGVRGKRGWRGRPNIKIKFF